jgi:hypothetical protein
MSTCARVKVYSMNAPKLPLPNPEDWATRTAVAEKLDVDVATVTRMVAAGRLTAYHPRLGAAESMRAMFWWPEVLEYDAARRTVRGER